MRIQFTTTGGIAYFPGLRQPVTIDSEVGFATSSANSSFTVFIRSVGFISPSDAGNGRLAFRCVLHTAPRANDIGNASGCC